MPSPVLAHDGSVSEVLAHAFERLGCVAAFGILGGAIAPFARAISRTRIPLLHVRHEGAAGFAAIEASLATGRPALVFATTGPGLTNCVTGMVASRREGAHVVFVTGSTPLDQIGRGAFQETSPDNGLDSIARSLVDHSEALHRASALDRLLATLADGLARPQGFTAHVALPLSIQSTPVAARMPARHAYAGTDVERHARAIADAIGGRRLAIWVGFGARRASEAIRALAERTGAVVLASPRAKGIFPEGHPQYLGVTGFGGHDLVARYRAFDPEILLVLGTRLGEMTSFWDGRLVPRSGLIHVDLDASAFGAAFPGLPVRGVVAEIAMLCEALVDQLPARDERPTPPIAPPVEPVVPRAGRVRPSALMHAIQRVVVEASDATVLTEAGNAFAWTTHLLRFHTPCRYRVSTGFGAMGMATAGVVGVAQATNRPAVAVVGDGAMLMHQEVSTAVAHGVPAIWIVLNDGRYGMIEQGMRALGWTPFAVELGNHDFVALARAVGADGVRVKTEAELDGALQQALAAHRPFVVDVHTDPGEIAPFGMRNQNLSRAIAERPSEEQS